MTDLTHLAELSSDALLVLVRGRVNFANAAAQVLLGGLQSPSALNGATLDSLLLEPAELHDDTRWNGGTRLGPLQVRPRRAVSAESGASAQLELTATRAATTADAEVFVCLRPLPAEQPDSDLQRLRDAISLSKDPVFLMDPRAFTTLDVNQPACEALGVSRESILARNELLVLRRLDGQPEQDYHTIYAQVIARAPQALTDDYEITSPTGRVFPVQITRHAVRAGERWVIFVTWRDIAARVAAQTSLEQFRAAFDQITDAINITDAQSLSYIYMNDAFLQLMALSREEVLRIGPAGMALRNGTFGALAGGYQSLSDFYASLVARYPEPVVRELAFTHTDGRELHLELRHHAFRSGDRWLVLSTRVDITARKHQQQHLERLRAAVNAAGDAIYVIDPHSHSYVEVNEAAARLLGIARDEVLGLGVRGAFPGLFDEAALRQRYADLIAHYPKVMTEERGIARRDGTAVWIESTLSAVKLENEWLIISVQRDATQRKAQQERLEQFKAAFDQSGDAIAIVDVDSMAYVYLNEANLRLFPVAREEMMALGPTGVARKFGDVTDLAAVYAELIRQHPQPMVWERDFLGKDGKRVYMELRQHALRSGDRWLVISSKVDITERKLAHARLTQLRAAIDFAPDAIYLIDPEALEYVDMNQAAGRIYGMTRDQVAAMGMLPFLASLGRITDTHNPESMRQDYADLIARYPQVDVRERRIRPPGRPEVVTETVRSAVKVNGQWLILSAMRDITERKREQARIERLAAVVNQSADAVFLIDRDAMKTVDVNEAACQMYGYSREALLALAPHLTTRTLASREEAAASYDEVIAVAPKVVRAELVLVRSDGSTFFGEAQRQAIRSDDTWIIVSTVRDITQRKAADARLKRLRAAIDFAPDAVYLIDPEALEYVDLNQAGGRLYGRSREEVLQMGMQPFLATVYGKEARPPEMLRRDYAALIQRHPEADVRERVIQTPGRPELIIETVRRALQVDGQWLIISMSRDITERKRAQARAERFAAVVNMSPDTVVLIDRTTMLPVDINEATCVMHRSSREELMALPLHQTLKDTTREEMEAKYDEAIRLSPAVIEEEVLQRRPDGSTFSAEVRRQALLSDGAWIIAVTVRDLTERKAAQARIERFAAVVNMSADALMLVDPEQMRFVDANEAACVMHGCTREELMATPVHLTLKDTTSQELQAKYREVIRQSPAVFREDILEQRPDGSTFSAEVLRQALLSGGQWIMAVTVRDLTERKAAQVRQAQLGAAINAAPDGIAVIDPQTLDFIHANDAVCLQHGVSRAELQNLGVAGLFRDKLSPDEIRAQYSQVIASYPRALVSERLITRADGTSGSYESVRRATQLDGRWLIISINRDISERKAAQASLERFAAVVNVSPDAVFVTDRKTMLVVDTNEAACHIYGHRREDLIGMPVAEAARIPVASIGLTMALYDRAIAEFPKVAVQELMSVRGDGSSFHAEVRRQAIRSEDRWLIVSTVRDITERKAALASIERFAALVNLSEDAVFVTDRETMRVVGTNDAACRIYGHRREDLVGMKLEEAVRVSPENIGFTEAQFDRAIAKFPNVTHQELVSRRSDGSPFHAEVRRQAIKSEGRWLIASTVRDITERKTAMARLETMRQAINAAPDAIFIIDPQTLDYVDINEAAVKLMESSREELMARGARGTYSLKQMPDDELKQRYEQVIAQAPDSAVEERALEKDGKVTFVEFTRRAVKVDGRWLIVSVNRDITERRAAVARLETLRQAINAAPDAIAVIDPKTLEYVDINEAAVQISGLSREALMARGVLGAYGVDPADRLRERYASLIASAPQSSIEVRTVARDGRTNYLEFTRRAVNVDGRWLVVSVNRDITERRAAQARLELLREAINAAPDAIVIIDPQTLEYIDVNEATAQMYGLTRDQLLARGARGGVDNTATDDDMRRLYAGIMAKAPQATIEERPMRVGERDLILEFTRRAVNIDGRWLIVSVNRDITERKAAQARIERFAAVVNLSADAVFLVDHASMRIIDVNPAASRMYGYTREEFLALRPNMNRVNLSIEELTAQYNEVVACSPEVLTSEIVAVRADGSHFIGEAHRLAIRADGAWTIVITVRDITEKRHAEEEIRLRVADLTRSNQELEQFAYVTSHDLSEPLRMVASYTQLLAKRYSDKFDDDGREFIGYAVSGAQRMKQLIDDLLMYSRAGRANVQMRHMRLDRALDDALANLANAIERTGATIERGPLPEMVCERAGLTQVFQNLVGNAIKFRGEAAPVVRISAVESPQFWTISVADNGIGISSEYFQRIFVIFQRLHARTKYEGTGIGLSICKKIVERHDGQITVSSEPGQGTTFSFTLSKSLKESEPT